MTDREIWDAAAEMVAGYGESALVMGAIRADVMLEAGDHAGCRDWQLIVKRIAAMCPALDEPETKH